MAELMDLLAGIPAGEERRRSQRLPAFGEVAVGQGNTTSVLDLVDVSETGLALSGRIRSRLATSCGSGKPWSTGSRCLWS